MDGARKSITNEKMLQLRTTEELQVKDEAANV